MNEQLAAIIDRTKILRDARAYRAGADRRHWPAGAEMFFPPARGSQGLRSPSVINAAKVRSGLLS
jgi:hypothetical protein